jgi:hypothetical protein
MSMTDKAAKAMDLTTKGKLTVELDEFEQPAIFVTERQASTDFVTDQRIVDIYHALRSMSGKDVVIRIKEVTADDKDEVQVRK